MTGVFVVADHELIRLGLVHLVAATDDLRVVGEARTVAEAVARGRRLDVDVAVLDLQLPDGSGLDVCRALRAERPGVACLVLTSFDDDEALVAAISAGAAGYVLKSARGPDLLEAVRTAATGRSLLDPAAARRVAQRWARARRPDDRLDRLTGQERAILELLGEGLTNRQIAARMFLAEKTVKNYVSSLLGKLGVSSRTQAALLIADVHVHGVAS